MAIDDEIKTAHDDQLKKLTELEQRLNDEERMHTQALQDITRQKQSLQTMRQQLSKGTQPTTSFF